MDAILNTIGNAIGALLGNATVGWVLRVAATYWIVVWLATALWAFVDLRRRTANPFIPYVSAAVVILASPILFPFVVLVHRVVRPAETVADRRMAELRDAVLVGELDVVRCPGCRIATDEEWLLCPSCRRALGHRCDRCGRTAAVDWDVCAWCGSTLATDLQARLAGEVPALRMP